MNKYLTYINVQNIQQHYIVKKFAIQSVAHSNLPRFNTVLSLLKYTGCLQNTGTYSIGNYNCPY
jgi:hypothetical protein